MVSYPLFFMTNHSIEVLFNRKLDITMLRTFGCTCFLCLRSYQTNKFNFHSEKCVYLGPSLNHKGYICLSLTSRVYVPRDVQLNEDEFSFTQQNPKTSQLNHNPYLISSPSILLSPINIVPSPQQALQQIHP